MNIPEKNITSEFDYFSNKKVEKVYLSKSIPTKIPYRNENDEIIEIIKPIRILSKVLESAEQHHFIKSGQEIVLRITPGERQQIIAKFYEDTREIISLQIQRYTKETGNPHKISFTFLPDEIRKLQNFIRNIPLLPIENDQKHQFEDKYLEKIVFTKEQLLHFISEQPEIIKELIEALNESDINKEDLQGLSHRKKQLEIFEKLLYEKGYFEKIKKDKSIASNEALWQQFFEANNWILGYGLNFIFNSPLEGKKLEQVTKGSDVFGSGKRVDLFMKTRGIINSLCFGEIKTHKTPLLKKVTDAYRRECWAMSDELAGGIAQIQKTVQISIANIKSKTEVKNEQGDLTGENLFLYQPKSFLIIGTLEEFQGEFGINEEKFSSFEIFRKNVHNPEILTFDELFERAKHIIRNQLIENK